MMGQAVLAQVTDDRPLTQHAQDTRHPFGLDRGQNVKHLTLAGFAVILVPFDKYPRRAVMECHAQHVSLVSARQGYGLDRAAGQGIKTRGKPIRPDSG